MRIAVLGLGEAGSRIAADLVGHGDEVHVYDPAQVDTPPGVQRHTRPESSVARCDLVLAVTPGSHARDALLSVIDALGGGVVYADLSTSAPQLKEELAGMASHRGVMFADVAVISPIPGRGLAAPALASGSGAEAAAELLRARGGNVEVIGSRAGQAATRKLLRSVMMKGLAALIIESVEAAERQGEGEWFWRHLAEQLTSIDEPLMKRLRFDTAPHARRRLEEMEAARDLLLSVGAAADMTTATITHLRRLLDEGALDFAIGHS